MGEAPLHIAMFPWFAMGHLIPYLHLSNKLAKRGHRISLIIPRNTQSKLLHFNLYPHLITFFPFTLPRCDGLPHNAETTSDVPFSSISLLMTAMDRTENHIQQLLLQLKPQIIFFDFVYWLPNMARRLGIKSLLYLIVNPATVAYACSPERMLQGSKLIEADLMKPPSGYPSSSIKLHPHEAKFLNWKITSFEFGSGVLFYDRLYSCLTQTDAIAFKGSTEIEGPFVDYLGNQFRKPALLSGPVIPEPPTLGLEEKWAKWLGELKKDSLVYCALGSECMLEKNQFQELLLGLELTGFPFLAVLKPPSGFESVEAAMPEGFKERVKEKGILYGGWVQQQAILGHPSVGCFVTHCGAGSLTEALVNKCQIVLLQHLDTDHIMNASSNLKVGVEVERGGEDGLFTREGVCKAVRSVMDDENEVGKEIRENHAKLRSYLLSEDLESSHVDSFCEKLRDLVK
ncbi:cyanidin 3-O-galactoside 2''-O-xylosyltransferase FGGT1-like isoform X2 [Prosopis cineraria]|uniref:cyanidin 3-O-galactoside 2''-O-xylosyltransferase FGGT1-like isoform X2 n=1 Tax=Prosopis cineraria TaxID=364024 RepID=UPI00240F5E98|nr:cyanidin 3-O-galactoside 2''-O-xylosyltransferase FGGT1-like isoform X2 [Prosopis cineraria]